VQFRHVRPGRIGKLTVTESGLRRDAVYAGHKILRSVRDFARKEWPFGQFA
jgi:hypothetical protein